ncbi:acyl-CoA dehydrogenase family protein [Halioxenophilus sp. WMMB6]|uniref:acyl-CoA dehydrogenase family protein n=1 Tax=Halioxenophilus sp. WMMB6 TaxID=3073815 RepID=UPI00295E3517|nr:acyl-CoA dehydrogenase family protein [Halioxenophilus sp. WMMB6]
MTTDQTLIARSRQLAPAIKARAAEAEALRRPHDDSIQELIEAGIMQMLVPKEWGGAEASLATMLEVVEIISSACVSTGWITAFYINHNMYVAKMGEQAQQEVFGSRGFALMPAINAMVMTAEATDGGWLVSGKAPWGSGIMHADWVLVSGVGEGAAWMFLLPASDVQVEDVWHFTGMAATGSNEVVLDKVFVPHHRTTSQAEFAAGPTPGSLRYANPIYSLPVLPIAYNTIAGVVTGGLLGAYEEYAASVAQRVRNFSGAVVKDQQHAHINLGEARIASQTTRDLARFNLQKLLTLANKQPFTLEQRLDFKGRVAFLSRLALNTVNTMMTNSGASSFHLDKPMQRYWRDLNTLCTHAFWDWDASRELAGRHQLGLEPNHPLA